MPGFILLWRLCQLASLFHEVHVYGWNILIDLTNETLNIYQLVTGNIPKLSCSVKKKKKDAMNLWSCVLTFDSIKFLN
jgi:hypothetical protein